MKKCFFITSVLCLLIFFSCRKDEMPPEPPPIPAEMQVAFTLNPVGVNPLCAKLNVEANVAGRIKIDLIGQDGAASDISHTFSELDTTHHVPILGLYADYENIVYVTLLGDNNEELTKDTIKIQTASLPENLPEGTVQIRKTDKMTPGFTLIGNHANYIPHMPYMIDAFGKIRWILDYREHAELYNLYFAVGIERLQNGNFYFGDASNDAIYEIDVYGEILNEWGLDGYEFHHNVQEKPNGNFLITVDNPDSYHENGNLTKEDFILEIDRQTGDILNIWDLKESLDEWRTTWDNVLNDSPMDWVHANAVIYDESDGNIIVSCQKQGLVKLDNDNNVQWILAPHLGWNTNRKGDNLNDFLLTPLDADGNPITDTQVLNGYESHPDFEWNWYQHAPLILPNGNLMLFDNGLNRHYNSTEKYSRAVEYLIDEEAMTVQQIWQYGKERDNRTYSPIVSDVDYLSQKNNILFSPGRCDFDGENIRGGRIVELDYATQEVVFEAIINGGLFDLQFHRTERLPIYADK